MITKSHLLVAAALFSSALSLGCQPTLVASAPDAGAPTDGFHIAADGSIPPSSGTFTHMRSEDGSFETLVDASSTTAWSYLDFETGLAVTPPDPLSERTWDVAFQRFKVISNGGASGMGGALVARITDTPFANITQAPEDGYIADAPDGDADRDDTPDSAFTNGVDDWYSYDVATHQVSPRQDITYIVRSPEMHFWKVQIHAYYDAAGSPGFLRFRWASVLAPASLMVADAGISPDAGILPDAPVLDAAMPTVPTDAVRVDASDRNALIYFDIETRSVVTPSDPSTDTVWDLAFRRVLVQTNSGSSGMGMGGARGIEGAPYASVTSTENTGFEVDVLMASEMPGTPPSSASPVLGAWFDYDFTTHAVTPKDITYIVRTGSGTFARMRIWAWTEGEFAFSVDPISAL
jgi:hypothetical protein